jgi:hypothetical protein
MHHGKSGPQAGRRERRRQTQEERIKREGNKQSHEPSFGTDGRGTGTRSEVKERCEYVKQTSELIL